MMRAAQRYLRGPVMRFNRWAVALLLSALCLQATGCAAKKPAVPPPKTYAVTGKVVTKDGKPVTGGMVQFESKTDNRLSVTSEIKADGTFALISRLDGQEFPGATAGEYQVTLFPAMSASQTEAPQVLPQKFTVEAKVNSLTLTAPDSKP
jgi:hypothetical protein